MRQQFGHVADQLEERFPDAARKLEEAEEEILAFTVYPKSIWKQIWSNNPLERLNKEIKRRTNVVGIFPNREAVIRLIGAVLAEQNDEWAITRRYMSAGALERAMQLALNPAPRPETEELIAATA